MKKKRIFKKTLAIKLMELGCNLVKVEPNNVNQSFMIYYFEKNETLAEALDTLMG